MIQTTDSSPSSGTLHSESGSSCKHKVRLNMGHMLTPCKENAHTCECMCVSGWTTIQLLPYCNYHGHDLSSASYRLLSPLSVAMTQKGECIQYL